jgi:hypothetical protein
MDATYDWAPLMTNRIVYWMYGATVFVVRGKFEDCFFDFFAVLGGKERRAGSDRMGMGFSLDNKPVVMDFTM